MQHDLNENYCQLKEIQVERTDAHHESPKGCHRVRLDGLQNSHSMFGILGLDGSSLKIGDLRLVIVCGGVLLLQDLRFPFGVEFLHPRRFFDWGRCDVLG